MLLPPDFAADILLKLSSVPLAGNTKWKRGLIEDAFLSAPYAQPPFQMLGDRPMSLDAVSSIRLEALTLQTRAVDAMLSLDPQRALVMFQDIPPLKLPKLSCQEALTPDVSAYYQTAAEVFNRAFTPALRLKGDDTAFLRDRVSAIDSPSQVVPALKLVDQLELSPPVRTGLMASFEAVLNRIDGGDREFAASESLLMGAAVPEMHEAAFLDTLRAYIVRQVSGPRCSDQIKAGQLPDSVTQFNKLISRMDSSGARYHPITAEEAAPLRDDGTYPPPVAESAHANQVRAAVHVLQNDGPSTREWTEHFFAALNLMESWHTEEEAAPEYAFFTLAVEYFVLLRAAPSGAAQRNAAGSFQRFLEQQYAPTGNHGLWFQEFRLLLNRVAGPNGSESDQTWLLGQLLRSRNPAMAAYAQLEKLTGTF